MWPAFYVITELFPVLYIPIPSQRVPTVLLLFLNRAVLIEEATQAIPCITELCRKCVHLFIVLIAAWFSLRNQSTTAKILQQPANFSFVFGKRLLQNSMKVMFKCLWKNCEKVLSTSSGIQRHIRTIHLGLVGSHHKVNPHSVELLPSGLSRLYLCKIWPDYSCIFMLCCQMFKKTIKWLENCRLSKISFFFFFYIVCIMHLAPCFS